MKNASRLILVLAGISAFLCGGTAQAVTFSISDINFTNILESNENFKLSVAASPVDSFELSKVDDSPVLIDGTLSTNDLLSAGLRERRPPRNPPVGPAPVPEPATMLLLGTGLVGLAAIQRVRKRNSQR